MNREVGKFDAAKIAAAKSKVSLTELMGRYTKVRGKGNRVLCLCPFHSERSPSCYIYEAEGHFHCFGCGQHGDHITILMQLAGRSFSEAVDILGGNKPISDEERAKIEAEKVAKAEIERKHRIRNAASCQDLFARSQRLLGTHGEAYLLARGLEPSVAFCIDLRYASSLPYFGFADAEADELTNLGEFPAMIAAIRDHEDNLIGIHRTYIDATEPKKLMPPGDVERNKAKKVQGEMKGGGIRLSQVLEHMVVGEGIETVGCWDVKFGGDNEHGLITCVSLNNLSGKPTRWVTHPYAVGKTIQNGEPDIDEPGIILPSKVLEVTILGDGDSEPLMTRRAILTACRRFKLLGITPWVDMAPDEFDFASMKK